jgi:hypothetical protein
LIIWSVEIKEIPPPKNDFAKDEFTLQKHSIHDVEKDLKA